MSYPRLTAGVAVTAWALSAVAGRNAALAQRTTTTKGLAVEASVVLDKFKYGGALGTSALGTWLHGVTVLPNGEIWLSAGSAMRVTAPQQLPPGWYLVRFDLYTTNPNVPVEARVGTDRAALTPCVMQPASGYDQSCELSVTVTSGAFDAWLEVTGPAAVSSVAYRITVSRFRVLTKVP